MGCVQVSGGAGRGCTSSTQRGNVGLAHLWDIQTTVTCRQLDTQVYDSGEGLGKVPELVSSASIKSLECDGGKVIEKVERDEKATWRNFLGVEILSRWAKKSNPVRQRRHMVRAGGRMLRSLANSSLCRQRRI